MKRVIITGASTGIGREFARRLASTKHDLLLVARSENTLKLLCEELMTEHGIDAKYLAIDLMGADAPEKVFQYTLNANMEISYLINNAGIGSGGDFLEHNIENEILMMHLNMDAVVRLTHLFLPGMRSRQDGIIVNVASLAAFGPSPYMAVYSATKAFMRSFTEAIAEENNSYRLQIMLLCPGATETEFFNNAGIGPERKKSFSTSKLQTPDEVVDAAMIGLKKHKRIVISGSKNRFLVALAYLIPNSFFLPLFAARKRKNLYPEV